MGAGLKPRVDPFAFDDRPRNGDWQAVQIAGPRKRCLVSLNTTDPSERAAYHAQIVSNASSLETVQYVTKATLVAA